MTLELLKSEALKLGRTELFDFAQFIIGALKEKDIETVFPLSPAQKIEIANRLKDVKNDPSISLNGEEAEKQLINKYALDV